VLGHELLHALFSYKGTGLSETKEDIETYKLSLDILQKLYDNHKITKATYDLFYKLYSDEKKKLENKDEIKDSSSKKLSNNEKNESAQHNERVRDYFYDFGWKEPF
jgi:hypothetical protein